MCCPSLNLYFDRGSVVKFYFFNAVCDVFIVFICTSSFCEKQYHIPIPIDQLILPILNGHKTLLLLDSNLIQWTHLNIWTKQKHTK